MILYYNHNLMGPPSSMWSVIDRNVIMRCTTFSGEGLCVTYFFVYCGLMLEHRWYISFFLTFQIYPLLYLNFLHQYTEGCKSRYTVIRVIQSKTVYQLLHPSVLTYQKMPASFKFLIYKENTQLEHQLSQEISLLPTQDD